MKKSLVTMLVFMSMFLSQQSFAWGKTGHNIVAAIAMQSLSDQAKQNVQKYLGDYTPESASVWMDDMRADHTYDFMKPWHYINIEKGQSYTPTTDENIINQLFIAFNELKHKQTICAEQARTDLFELFHLAGDLHQPLHAGYGSDHGGNNVHVNFLSKQENLHWVWDDLIIQQQHISLNTCMAYRDKLTKEETDRIKTIDFVSWMNESKDLLPVVYDFQNNTIDAAYCNKNNAVIEKRLVYAGIRLGAILEQLFGSLVTTK